MTAERRFMLLVACALTAIIALMTLGHLKRGPAVEPPAERAYRAATDGADERQTTSPGLVLGRLWSTTMAQRFPEVVLALTREDEPPVLDQQQIVSYYGNPYSADMGILGTANLETVAAQLEQHAARYDELNGQLGVIPAIHLVYGVAQYHPTDNGLFLQYVDDADVERYISLTAERDMLLFLDLQIGRSSVDAELRKAVPYLRHPHVHLAIDPEFAVGDAEVPGTDLGSLRAQDIDRAQAVLQRLVDEEELPPKLLIVHQFLDSMLEDGEAIRRYPAVELIIDMDGFGPAEVKRVKYQQFASRSYALRAAIKLFFEHDPDLMSEEDVLRLEPTPAVVIYQ